MCSFGSCQTRFEFLSQFRKVRNAFECFVTQVQTRLPNGFFTKCIWPMKINVICTVSSILYYMITEISAHAERPDLCIHVAYDRYISFLLALDLAWNIIITDY